MSCGNVQYQRFGHGNRAIKDVLLGLKLPEETANVVWAIRACCLSLEGYSGKARLELSRVLVIHVGNTVIG